MGLTSNLRLHQDYYCTQFKVNFLDRQGLTRGSKQYTRHRCKILDDNKMLLQDAGGWLYGVSVT